MKKRVISMSYQGLAIIIVLACLAGKSGYLSFADTLTISIVAGAIMFVMWFLVKKHFREYEIKPVTKSSMPPNFSNYVEGMSPWFEELGFDPIGDFELWPPPSRFVIRIFTSRGGRCFGLLFDLGGLQKHAFISVLSDGTYIESLPVKLAKRKPSPHVPLRLGVFPNASIVQLYDHHLAYVHEIEEEVDAVALRFSPEQWTDVANYGHRLAGMDLHEQGVKWSAPERIAESNPTELVESFKPTTKPGAGLANFSKSIQGGLLRGFRERRS